jgi:glyoxylase-like metal-dependent hydrolase (beta-lactamase superfamily II)
MEAEPLILLDRKMLQIKRIINQPVTSNCFILHRNGSADCIVIDPGSVDNKELVAYLQEYKLNPKFVILTHQHFDHIWGVNDLRGRFEAIKIICNEECSKMINNKKENFSLFYDQKGFEVSKADIITEKIHNYMEYDGLAVKFYNTPGHSPASICFTIENYLFTGDTLIYDEKTITKLPKGSRTDLTQAIIFLESLKGLNLVVCPGHGEIFDLDTYDTRRAF